MDARVVEDPLAVLDTLHTFKPDLILMDLYMPRCNGMELTTLIREQPEFLHTPIVFLSGESDQEVQFEVIDAGADDFLAKPVRPRHLIAAVQNRVQRACWPIAAMPRATIATRAPGCIIEIGRAHV